MTGATKPSGPACRLVIEERDAEGNWQRSGILAVSDDQRQLIADWQRSMVAQLVTNVAAAQNVTIHDEGWALRLAESLLKAPGDVAHIQPIDNGEA